MVLQIVLTESVLKLPKCSNFDGRSGPMMKKPTPTCGSSTARGESGARKMAHYLQVLTGRCKMAAFVFGSVLFMAAPAPVRACLHQHTSQYQPSIHLSPRCGSLVSQLCNGPLCTRPLLPLRSRTGEHCSLHLHFVSVSALNSRPIA